MSLTEHIATGVTTLCYCWVITRQDNVTIGFTDHDEDVTVDGVLCYASAGITTTKFQRSLGLVDDNLDVDGVIDNDMLTETDLALGRYDEGSVRLYLVNWTNPTEFDLLARGRIGTVTSTDLGKFTAEFRSESDQLGQSAGRLFQRTCGTFLGATECGVNTSLPAHRLSSTATAAEGHVVTVSGATAYADEWFALGTLTHAATGVTYRIRRHVGDLVYLWERPKVAIEPGDAVMVIAGCRRTDSVCAAKFSNIVNFRGFPFMPGQDYLSGYPIRGKSTSSGSVSSTSGAFYDTLFGSGDD